MDTEHVYSAIRNYTAELLIHNEASTEELTLLIVVEPVLEDTIEIYENYTPKAVPLDVMFVVRRTTIDALPPINVWCDFVPDMAVDNTNETTFAALTLDLNGEIEHQYTVDEINSTPRITCENHVSSFVYDGEIKLRENFTNITLGSSSNADYAVRTGDEVLFVLNITEGSHAVIQIDFGDTNTETITLHEAVLSYEEPIEIQHTYTDPITATVTVELTNEYFTVSSNMPYDLIVQHIVQGLSIDYPPNILVGDTGEGTLDITVTPDGGLPTPTDVSCYWNMGAGNNVTEFSEELSTGQEYVKPLTFVQANVGLGNEVSISCYNLVSSQELNASIDVYEEVLGISFVQPPLFALKNHPMFMQIFLEFGSHVSYNVQLGNGDEVTLINNNTFATNNSFPAALVYSGIGNFTPSVVAENLLSSVSGTLDDHVTVQNDIAHLDISVGAEYIWPPGIAEYEIVALPEQEDIHNMHCTMVYYNNDTTDLFTSDLYVDAMSASDVVSFTYDMSRPLLGNTTVNATCGNMVSNTTIQATTLVTLDAVILKNLTTNETVLWTNTTLMIVDIERFGTNACFQFDMGDGRDFILYGSTDFCESYALDPTDPELYQQVEHGTIQLYHEYIYRQFGEYNVTVFAFNHVSNDSLTTEAEVLDWPCIPPNITLPGNESDIDAPLLIPKSVHFFIQPDTFIDCMKTSRFTNVWELFELGSAIPLATSGGEDYWVRQPEPFQQERRLLAYGSYELLYTASMFNVTPEQINSSITYFDIVSTPLSAGFVEGYYSVHPYDTMTQLDLVGGSFDLDVEPEVKTDMTFTWLCRRSDEDEVDVDSSNVPMGFGTSNTEDNGGCFGTGRGVLDLPDSTGLLAIDTKYMLPDTNYTIDGWVFKDDREATVRHHMYIEPSEAPVLEMR